MSERYDDPRNVRDERVRDMVSMALARGCCALVAAVTLGVVLAVAGVVWAVWSWSL